jgi:hypothetical protein
MDKEILVNESLKEENSFSSSTHGSAAMTNDAAESKKDFPIPKRYYKNSLKLLPVNTKKYYVYWELFNLNIDFDKMAFRIMEDKMILSEFSISSDWGEYYINEHYENRTIYAVLGYYHNNTFIEVLRSNTITTFSTQIKFPQDNKEVWIKKEKGFKEVIRASLNHFTIGMSSASYVEELKVLGSNESILQQSSTGSSYEQHTQNQSGGNND